MVSPLKIPLQITCPHCQQGNLPGSPYCSGCGAPLGEIAPGSEPIVRTAVPPIDEDPIKRFLSEGQDRLLVKQSYERAFGVLTTGESIDYIAVAGKASLAHPPDCLVSTSKRIMLLRKKVLGKYELDDCYWRDVREVSLKDGKVGFTLTIEAIQGWRMTAEALPRAQALRLLEVAAERNERVRELLHAHQVPFGMAALASAVAAPATPAAMSAGLQGLFVNGANQNDGSGVTPAGRGTAPAVNAQVAPVMPADSANAQGALEHLTATRQDGKVTTPAGTSSSSAGFVPTPESVLQSILQQSQAVQEGAPTRPMQFSAAAFQAPAITEAQPVTFRDTDTEPNMRPAPPMPTLEQIAVFSGPLAFGHPNTGDISSALTEVDVPADRQAPPSDAHVDSWMPSTNSAVLANSSPEAGLSAVSASANDNFSTESPGENNQSRPLQSHSSTPQSKKPANSGAVADSAQAFTSEELEEDLVSGRSEAVDMAFDPADVMGFMMSAGSDMAGGPMPLPGTLSSGPLLSAGHYDSLSTMSLQQYANDTGGLATQNLSFDPSTDDLGSDRPTDINLGEYRIPASQPTRGEKKSSSATAKSQSGRNSASSGGRSSQSKQSGDDPISKMKQLKMLLDAGFITESDYEAKKADILARYF